MTHTACLQDLPSTEHEVSPAPDAVQLALSAELVCEPGSQYAYSNKAVNLLAGIIHRASGEPLDALAKRVLFAPLGIQDFFWSKDRAGNPYVTGGLWLTPRDLVKIGQLVAQRGQWKGQQLLPHAWFDSLATTRPPQPEFYGLLWWGPQGSALRGSEQAQDVLIANGWRGQWLWVNMQTKLVAARVYDLARGTDRPEVSFDDFGRLMTGLQAVPAD